MAHTKSWTRKPIPQATTAALALIVFSCMLRVVAAQECHLFHSVIWAALQLLRPAILAAKASMPAHPCQASTLLQYLLQIVASNWPPPQPIVG
jgi:hypothetical protein